MSSLGGKLPIYGQGPRPADGQHRWRSLSELEKKGLPSPEFPEGAADPPEGLSRRGFVQLLGASAALATLGGACRPPRHKILPYVRPPEKALLPGTPVHYATAVTIAGHATGLLVTSWDGRPIKVEGNPDHPASLGGVGSHELAMLLDLYDPRRAKGFRKRQGPLAHRTLLRELTALAATHEKDGGARLRFLTGADASPLKADLRRRILERFPQARFVAYESLAADEAREGARLAFGRPLAARHALKEARAILSLDADFLAVGPEALRLAREFAERREPGPEMNRLYAAESQLSVTGSNADHRFRMKPSEVLAFARAVAGELASKHGAGPLAALGGGETRFGKQAAAVAADLAKNRGRSLVLAGAGQPPAVHALAHAMNAALGNAGKTVSYGPPAFPDPAGPGALRAFAEELSGGKVETVVVTAHNPVYAAPADVDLSAALGKAKDVVYLTYRDDETAPRASWVLAASHPFESWGDARAHDGTVSLVQPLIQPLFESTTEVEVLAAFANEADAGPYRLLREYWAGQSKGGDFERRWEGWLAKGVVEGTAAPPVQAAPDPGAVAAAVKGAAPGEGGGLEASFVPDYKLLDGRFAENAWLQELPQPISKVTWDNPAYVSPATMQKLGLKDGARVELRLGGRAVEAAVWTMPGHADEVVTLPLGYGRSRGGPVGTGVGFDFGRLRTAGAPWSAAGLAVAPLRGTHPFALTQEHFSMEGRDIALAFDAAAWSHEGKEKVEELRGAVPRMQDPVDYGSQQYKWGMAIDLAKCIGCGACTTACQAENNIPVVGKEQVARSREMHWLRVDRYFEGSPEDPKTVAQPLMCVHCEAAPCEYVCPVNATVHSDEGLNEMVYNRCVGTRYCSNNCPYKVRRFNYLDYLGEKSPTEKMAMNPDVTVRTRGVMEKCTYCVQRIERARIGARVAGRTIQEGEFTTACAQACPANAIVFGNLNDPKSAVSRLHQDERRYDLLHDLGTRPRTAYLVRVRNPNPELT
ncbi:MAG TPA: Fe-S-cluster-containing hydrogenase [Anaeromyxobacteraceae bacterium]|nr:Fe-S-cluster-containing hydrogenase [Anaeromyxobacteraceae bacterium]